MQASVSSPAPSSARAPAACRRGRSGLMQAMPSARVEAPRRTPPPPSLHPLRAVRPGRRTLERAGRMAALGSEEPEDSFVTTEDAFHSHVGSADVVVADFMARWCRKCIYIKPKLVTLMSSKFPAVPLAFIDVNAVPSGVVSGAGVTKMPTIVVYVKGEAVGSYVAGESASAAVLKVEEMVRDALKKVGRK